MQDYSGLERATLTVHRRNDSNHFINHTEFNNRHLGR